MATKKKPVEGEKKGKKVPPSAGAVRRKEKPFEVCEFHRKIGMERGCIEEQAALCEHGPNWRQKLANGEVKPVKK